MTERESHFLDLFCGSHEFFTVKEWMEKNMPKEWEEYLYKETHSTGKFNHGCEECRAWTFTNSTLNDILNLSNLVAFLTENRGWGWRKCPECDGKGWMEVPSNMDAEMIEFVCEYCNGSGKVEHPALVRWDKEE